MSVRISLISIALLATGCSGGGGSSEQSAPPPTIPPMAETQSAPIILTTNVGARVGAELSFEISAQHADDDPLTFTLISGPDWLTLSSAGQLSGVPTQDDIGSREIMIEVSDGTNTVGAAIRLEVFDDPIEQALRVGDYTPIDDAPDMSPTSVVLDMIDEIRNQNNADIAEIYKLGPGGTVEADSLTEINWVPRRVPTAYFDAKFGYNAPLFVTNYSPNYGLPDRSDIVGLFGRVDDGRYITVGYNPLRGDFDDTSQFHLVMKSAISWLIKADADAGLNVVIAQVDDDPFDQDSRETVTWLESAYGDAVSMNTPGRCDGVDFDPCITSDTDLIIIYQKTGGALEAKVLRDRVAQALSEGVGVLHVHTYTARSGLGANLLDLINATRIGTINSWNVRLSNASPLEDAYDWAPDYIQSIEFLANGIEANTLDYDLSACSGPITCAENPAFQSEIASKINHFRKAVTEGVRDGVDPFPVGPRNRLYGALLLLGDYYRDQTQYPMPKTSTPSTDIIRALVGELTTVLQRESTPAAKDLGSYSRSDFDPSLFGDVTVALTTKAPFTTTGVYAVPGETVSVTRKDDEPQNVILQVQSLRDQSGEPFRTIDGTTYTRPVFITSDQIRLEAGQTVTFTSPYGGPIHLYSGRDDLDVELDFKNVGEHPIWRGPQDTEAFLIALAADEYDWAEFVAPSFEIHSSVSKMRETFSLPRYQNDPATLAIDADTYLHDWPNWLNGRQGDTVRENPDLITYSEGKLVDIPSDITRKHVNADRAACDETCSGNPYDSNHAFSPFGGPDLRAMASEIGGSWDDLFISHSLYRFYQDTGQTSALCPALAHEHLYNLLQAAQRSGDPADHISDEDLSSKDAEATFYIQLMAALENQNVFTDGWLLIPRRRYNTYFFNAGDFPNIWNLTQAVQVGYPANPSRLAMRQLPIGDRLLIDLSWATGRDLRAYLRMWGYEFLPQIEQHVAAYGFPSLSPAYYAIGETDHCRGLNHTELPVDGTSTWP